MFDACIETTQSGVTRFSLLTASSTPLRFDQVAGLWCDSAVFRDFFIELLTASPYTAYRFETPPVNRQTFTRSFEFVLIDSPWLNVPQDASPFSEHFRHFDADVISFKNLGGDAMLVVPCPEVGINAYAHLARFINTAPATQKHHLWQRVGQSLIDLISEQTIWLNTAGGGVDWLHVRLDSSPKYYAYQAYKHD